MKVFSSSTSQLTLLKQEKTKQTDIKGRGEQTKKIYYDEINYFRGFAIFCIVWAHFRGLTWGAVGGHVQSSWEIVNNIFTALISGNTAFFVFISGFLFYSIFYKRGFDYQSFIRGKFLKVFMPYLIITLTFICYRLLRDHGSIIDSNFLIYGGFLYWSFWYVPYIMVAFIFSPLYLKFIETKNKYQIILFALSLALSICLGRHNTNPILSFFFWNSFYLAGILLALNYERYRKLPGNDRHCILCITIAFMGLLISWDNMYYFKDHWTYDVKFAEKIELLVIGKILCAIVLMDFFFWFKGKGSYILKSILATLAKYSFSIFFLHQFAILYFERHPHKTFIAELNIWQMFALSLMLTILVCALCIMVAYLIKCLTKQYSRIIIGV